MTSQPDRIETLCLEMRKTINNLATETGIIETQYGKGSQLETILISIDASLGHIKTILEYLLKETRRHNTVIEK